MSLCQNSLNVHANPADARHTCCQQTYMHACTTLTCTRPTGCPFPRQTCRPAAALAVGGTVAAAASAWVGMGSQCCGPWRRHRNWQHRGLLQQTCCGARLAVAPLELGGCGWCCKTVTELAWPAGCCGCMIEPASNRPVREFCWATVLMCLCALGPLQAQPGGDTVAIKHLCGAMSFVGAGFLGFGVSGVLTNLVSVTRCPGMGTPHKTKCTCSPLQHTSPPPIGSGIV